MSDDPIGETTTQFFTYASAEDPVRLEHGQTIGPVTIAYETYGTLNARRNNAVLVFHALTGSQNAAGTTAAVPGAERYWTDECHAGWWSGWIGPGRALDTDRYCVICANYLGGCYGSTGPASLNPATGKPYGPDFPTVTMSDIVDSQVRLLDHLGIQKTVAVIGGSIGGMLALDYATRYPHRTHAVIPIAAGARATALTKVLNFEQIFAIEEDANFNFGWYYDGPRPEKGLVLARMISHKTFISLYFMEQRARNVTRQEEGDLKGYRIQHQLESYMLHQGKKFAGRFDANTYLRLMNAWQQFDLTARSPDGTLEGALRPCLGQRFLVFSIDSDVCFYPEEQAELVDALKHNSIGVQHVTIHSEKGHDSFLLEPEIFLPHVHYLLGSLCSQIEEDVRASMARRTDSETLVWHI